MTQEDKELLLADLLARLSHGVKIRLGDYDYQVCGYNSEKEMPVKIWYYYDSNLTLKSYIDVYLTDYRPYLRPMSSMTEKEKDEMFGICTLSDCSVNTDWEYVGIEIMSSHPRYGDYYSTDYKVIDWLNKNMFDYRGLISKGLALEAPEGMYEINEK